MIVGDSISHGLEGDYTWRYRLSQNFGKHGFPVRFVGPETGTSVLPASQPGDYPARTADPVHNGRYRPGIDFGDSRHYARWGRLLHEAKDGIRDAVAAHGAGYLMVELGFNDLAWGVSGPGRLTADLVTFVRRARDANPDVQFLVANVVHRTPLDSSPGLADIITAYNEGLPSTLAAMSTARSAVALVDLDSAYDPGSDTYDGLHPNSVGEFKIAKAFADSFSSAFGHGRIDFLDPVPRTADPLAISPPSGIAAISHGSSISVSWPHVFGASGYWLYWRDVTAGQGFQRSPLPILADSLELPAERGHTYEFMVSGARGHQETPATRVAVVLGGQPALSLAGGQGGR
ncbi:GDSL-type esterase/lipase family protein [Streptosporangium roseum]|uniref:GDSL-type esterase/lipase family protein n=1 Tax=Streptosporangium roseum TaxID=2001 RepID=UPI0004CDD6B1|nr:GDSL-type esterase/lipase family protein [Streptosporangium roseum]